MALTRREVRRIAALARLSLTDDEERAAAEQLDHILTYFDRLKSLNTQSVEPTAHAAATQTSFRADAVENKPAAAELLANAPERDGALFKVPKIIE